jgi:UTP-glucose-1-phosphate uridylyltransferase
LLFYWGIPILDGYWKPVTHQLMEVYEQYQASVVALKQVPAEKVQ